MTTDAWAIPPGHVHEAALYGSDDELLGIVVPFLRQGRDAREPTLAVLDEPTVDRVRAALGDTAGVAFVGAHGHYANPAALLRTTRDALASHTAGGAERIRMVGAVPHDPATGAQWDWWARYESAVNHAFAQFPVWNVCPYDLRAVSDAVLDDVLRTHPRIATGDGRRGNPRYEEPARFRETRSRVGPDPVQRGAPLVDLCDPSPAAGRRAARHVAAAAGLGATGEEDLVTAVSETVTNALMYGLPPVRLRLWVGPDRVVAAVDDRGGGPLDPFAGLLPTTDTSSAGMGLWLTHRICSQVVFSTTPEGFTVRMVVDRPDGSGDAARHRPLLGC